jgi:C4-dicarboxylate-specific signal transduction histidine kinase
MIANYLPLSLQSANGTRDISLRTRLECRARRGDGEPFLAYVWLASYNTCKTAIVIWDGTDDLRDREDAGFDSLMATSRILLGGISHELRNFVVAAKASHSRLGTVPGVLESAEYERLGRVLAALENTAGSGLRLAAKSRNTLADLRLVLDEIRIMIEPGLHEEGIAAEWPAPDHLPRVHADQQGLAQVFVNLLRNSRRALAAARQKRIRVSVESWPERIIVRVQDSGRGVANPARLFDVFQPGAETGLGLYLSRALMLSFGGDLRYEEASSGACFAVELKRAEARG